LYLSNVPDARHKQLTPPRPPDTAKKFDYFEAIAGLLASAKRDLPHEEFNAGIRTLAEKFWPTDDVHSALHGLQQVRLSPSRSSTPKRKKDSPENSPRLLHQRRVTTAAQEQAEARKNLEYSYFTEDNAANTTLASSTTADMELVGKSS
jgi:hypothetical protein